MKLCFENWEIEIEAKGVINPQGADQDTKYFLNFLSILYGESARLERLETKEAIKSGDIELADCKARVARIHEDVSFEIYQALANRGFYDNVH